MVGLIDLFNVGLFINRHEIDTENAEKVKSEVFKVKKQIFFFRFILALILIYNSAMTRIVSEMFNKTHQCP